VAVAAALAVMGANGSLVWAMLDELRAQSPLLAALGTSVAGAALALLLWISFVPLRSERHRVPAGVSLAEPVSDSL
jgi:hypothetical protein